MSVSSRGKTIDVHSIEGSKNILKERVQFAIVANIVRDRSGDVREFDVCVVERGR